MKRSPPKEVFLTFDVEGPEEKEDYFPRESAEALLGVLAELKRFRLTGLFFITGTVAEKLQQYPEMIELLSSNLIGYHSSSHSIRPRIFEYTDVEDYQQAMKISLERETSSIDPHTGNILGEGGIQQMRRIFHNNDVKFFRAPFLCWSPPHMECLKELGFKFDFSTNVSYIPVQFKGLTMFPKPTIVDTISEKIASVVENQKRVFPRFLLRKMLTRQCTVLLLHPSKLACPHQDSWSEQGTNTEIRFNKKKGSKATINLVAFRMLLSELSVLRRTGAIVVTPSLKTSINNLDIKRVDAEKLYEENASICKRLFGYNTKYMRSHFRKFFEKST
jgi:hypothetical protein